MVLQEPPNPLRSCARSRVVFQGGLASYRVAASSELKQKEQSFCVSKECAHRLNKSICVAKEYTHDLKEILKEVKEILKEAGAQSLGQGRGAAAYLTCASII